MRDNLLLLLTICSLLVPDGLYASDIGSFVLSSRRLTVADGLTDNTVYDITEDTDGFIWLGAAYGLCRWDGYRFLTYDNFSADSHTIGATTANIYPDTDRQLMWVKTSTRAYACYDLNKGQFTKYTGQLDAAKPFRRHLITKNAVWLYDTNQGIRRITRQPNGTFQCRQYNTHNQLPSSNIRRMAEDAKGNVWAATDRGLVRFDNNAQPKTITPCRDVIALNTYHGNIIALSAPGQLEMYTPAGKRLRSLTVPQTQARLNTVRADIIWQDQWILFCPKTWTLDLKHWRLTEQDPTLHDAFLLDNIDGCHFVSNNTGRLWIYPPKGKTLILDLLPNLHFTADRRRRHKIAKASDGTFFIATYGAGLYAWDIRTNQLRHFSAKDPQHIITTDYLSNIYIDSRDRLWIAEDASGIDLINITKQNIAKFIDITPENKGTWNGYVGGLFLQPDGNILASTRANTLYRLDPHTLTPQPLGDTPSTIAAIINDPNGHQWTAYRGRGLNIDGTLYTKGDTIHHTPTDNYTAAALDRHSRIWLATTEDGLLCATYNKTTGLKYQRLLTSNPNQMQQWAIHLDNRGLLWLATSDGLYSIDTKQKEPHKHIQHYCPAQHNFPLTELRSLTTTKDYLWAGGKGGGIVRCRLNRQGHITANELLTTDDGLASGNINTLLPDKYGQIWAATPLGLSRIWDTDMKVQTYRFRQNGDAQIYSSAAITLPDGRLLFGTRTGITIITPQPKYPPTTANRVLITALGINGQPYQDNNKATQHLQTIKLQHTQNSIDILFSNLDYGEDDAALYQYRLDGVDEQWRPKTRQPHAEYANLTPGNYTFHVRTLTTKGWSNTTSLNINIQQPWYNTIWAWLIYITIATTAIIYVLNTAKTRFRLKEQIKLERQMTDFHMAFFTNITHEFRTPLAIIQGAVERLQQNDALQMHQAQQTALRGARRLGRLITQLMEFRRINTKNIQLNVTEDDIVSFLKQLHQDFWNTTKQHSQTYTFTPFTNKHNTLFDHRVLENIVYNLLSNAVKYTPDGGNITMRLKQNAGQLIIEIQDNGPGLSKEQQQTMFQPFMKGNVATGGMGIGLYLAKNMATLHHATLTYQKATTQGGSIFTLKMPDNDIYTPEEHATAIQNTTTDTTTEHEITRDLMPQALNDINIAIIEDDTDMSLEITAQTGPYFHTTTYYTGKTALEGINNNIPALILCDMILPDMRGTDIVTTLRNNNNTKNIPIIMLTALDDETNRLRSYNAGADDYMVKPCNARILIARMTALIKQNRQTTTQPNNSTAPDIITTDNDKRLLDRIETIVQQHLADPNFNIEHLALSLGLGRTKAYNKVKELTGMTPAKYIQNQRMQYAAELIKEGQLTIAEIAYKVGINDASYFNKCFKAKYGTPPSKYLES